MKLCLITDTHWGIRQDNISFLDNNKKFLDNIFFPFIDKHNIDTVIHLGDIVDRRKYVNYLTANRLRNDFLLPLEGRKLNCHFIAGNHDCTYKNTNEVNAFQELIVGKYENFNVYDRHSTEVKFDGMDILFIPWICDDNRKQIVTNIQNTPAQIAMGHLEIQGFEMFRGSVVSHGDDRNVFSNFDMVMSGHYHHKSSDGSIFYLGSHGEFTWSDYDDPKGFHIFDTDTRELTFVKNPFIMFNKVWYNDKTQDYSNPKKIDCSSFNDTILKVIIQEKTNPYYFDRFIEHIESSGVINLQIVEDHLNLNIEDDENIINEAESTLDICKKYISSMDTEKIVDKDKLNNKIVELYNMALTSE